MTTTVQILMAVFSVLGFVIAKIHTWASSPVGSDVMRIITQAVEQQQAVQAHSKVQGLAAHGVSLFKDLAAVKHAADGGAAAAAVDGDAELKKVLEQAAAAYRAKQAAVDSTKA